MPHLVSASLPARAKTTGGGGTPTGGVGLNVYPPFPTAPHFWIPHPGYSVLS